MNWIRQWIQRTFAVSTLPLSSPWSNRIWWNWERPGEIVRPGEQEPCDSFSPETGVFESLTEPVSNPWEEFNFPDSGIGADFDSGFDPGFYDFGSGSCDGGGGE